MKRKKITSLNSSNFGNAKRMKIIHGPFYAAETPVNFSDRAGARLPGGGDGNENATLTMSFVIKQSHVGIDENTFSPGSFE